MTDASDDELMRSAGEGDHRAFVGLVERHYPRAVRLAGRIVGSTSEAEDIVQEALLRTWRKAPDWRPVDSGGARFSTWLHRVVVNLCLDRLRRPSCEPLEAAAKVSDAAPDALARAAASETARRVAASVAELPDRQRAAFVLCHYEDMSNIEAARVLNVSVRALESLLVRARRSLRAALADLTDQPAGDHRT